VSLKYVRDHVDVISSEMFNTMLRAFRGMLAGLGVAGDVLKRLKQLPPARTWQPVDPEYVNAIVDACSALCDYFHAPQPPGLHRVSVYQLVRDSDVNQLVDCINTLIPLLLDAYDVFLLNPGDGTVAKLLAADDALIFSPFLPEGLTSAEVRDIVRNKRTVFTVMLDEEPWERITPPAWYRVFYYSRAEDFGHYGCPDKNIYYHCSRVVDESLKSEYPWLLDDRFYPFLGERVPNVVDACTSYFVKMPGVKQYIVPYWYYEQPPPGVIVWTPTCGFSWLGYERGFIIEVPFDGVWASVDWLSKFITAISSVLLGAQRPKKLVYMGRYDSLHPESHECYPADSCLRALAELYGWRVLDMRDP
jgi:hypothetical protein